MTRTRSHSLDAGGLNWNSLPLKLFAGGNAKFWNPADIDFSRDRADWEALTDLEREWATRLCAQFIAGEEAVTQDIQPFMAAMRAEGRLGDEMYLTQFAFEEAKHTQVFRLWPAVPGMTDDLQVTDDPLKVASGAAALVVLTEWPEFRLLDWGRLAELVERRIVVDTRNLLDADVLRRVGFEVRGIGRRPTRALTPS